MSRSGRDPREATMDEVLLSVYEELEEMAGRRLTDAEDSAVTSRGEVAFAQLVYSVTQKQRQLAEDRIGGGDPELTVEAVEQALRDDLDGSVAME